jgi:hypothetical protein
MTVFYNKMLLKIKQKFCIKYFRNVYPKAIFHKIFYTFNIKIVIEKSRNISNKTLIFALQAHD